MERTKFDRKLIRFRTVNFAYYFAVISVCLAFNQLPFSFAHACDSSERVLATDQYGRQRPVCPSGLNPDATVAESSGQPRGENTQGDTPAGSGALPPDASSDEPQFSEEAQACRSDAEMAATTCETGAAVAGAASVLSQLAATLFADKNGMQGMCDAAQNMGLGNLGINGLFAAACTTAMEMCKGSCGEESAEIVRQELEIIQARLNQDPRNSQLATTRDKLLQDMRYMRGKERRCRQYVFQVQGAAMQAAQGGNQVMQSDLCSQQVEDLAMSCQGPDAQDRPECQDQFCRENPDHPVCQDNNPIANEQPDCSLEENRTHALCIGTAALREGGGDQIVGGGRLAEGDNPWENASFDVPGGEVGPGEGFQGGDPHEPENLGTGGGIPGGGGGGPSAAGDSGGLGSLAGGRGGGHRPSQYDSDIMHGTTGGRGGGGMNAGGGGGGGYAGLYGRRGGRGGDGDSEGTRFNLKDFLPGGKKDAKRRLAGMAAKNKGGLTCGVGRGCLSNWEKVTRQMHKQRRALLPE